LAAATFSGSPVILRGFSEPLAVLVSWTTTSLTPNCSLKRLMVSPPLPIISPHLFPGSFNSTISMLFRCSTVLAPGLDGSLPSDDPRFRISSMLLLARLKKDH